MKPLQKLKLNENQKMVKLISKEQLANLLKKVAERLANNEIPNQTGKVKAVIFEKKKIKHGDTEVELDPFHEGQIVFTKDGIGTVVIPKWRSSIRSGDGRLNVMLRKNRKRIKLYREEDLFKLVVTNQSGMNIPVSPMFYDYLITSIDKEVKYKINNRKVAMLLDEEQQRLKKDYLASLSGAFHVVRKLQNENIW